MSDPWVAVYSGPIANASLARSRLEAAGIPCLIPAETMKILDPFDTGGLIFDYQVTVPISAAASARKLLDDTPEDTEIRADEEELPAGYFDAGAQERIEDKRLEHCLQLSRYVRWGAVSWIGAPFAIVQFLPYLRAVRDLGRKPPQHFATIAAFGLALVLLGVVLALLLRTPIKFALSRLLDNRLW